MKTPAASPIGDVDLHLFNEGTHTRLYEKLGAQVQEGGTHFAVWAPNAERVTVMGDFNGWNKDERDLALRGDSGIWEGFLPGIGVGEVYKFHVRSRHAGFRVDKADPFAFHAELAPRTGSIVWRDDYRWGDDRWMAERAKRSALDAPIAIYELHLGSWRRVPEEGNRFLGYREMAAPLIEHVRAHGFTHVELMPVMEHPFYGSWGYQVTGYFAPTSRYGTPADLKYLVDRLHQAGIGVILDWVPSHFPGDDHGLYFFDGTHLYEHADPRQGHHPDWDSWIFNYGRKEVRSFLLSSACYWLDRFHADGLRVDGVASMLYLDYSRKEGEWIPNPYGGRENLDAMEFLRRMNTAVYGAFPGIQTYAEESTSWPMVSRPVELGGLGFGLKWDMGWMHDTLAYFELDPIFRKYHHQRLTFRGLYAHHENFVLPLSHDEVVHGKRSLVGKTSGDDWQKRANLRLLYAYMTGVTGKKLLFMGGELGQWREWDHDSSLDWHLSELPEHAGIGRCLGDLNRLYRGRAALHERDCDPRGFAWIDCNDALQSTLSFLRFGKRAGDVVLVACNFTPVVRERYRLGVPRGGRWREVFNSDAGDYGGSGVGNLGGVEAVNESMHGHGQSIELVLPPLAAVFLEPG
jgi:1,4-alpha-glucan branching enzyme